MAFTKEERARFYAALYCLDSEKQYVVYNAEDDTLSYTSRIDSKENIVGRPTDEELTRALILLHLIIKYDFDSTRIIIEDRFTMPGHNTTPARSFENDIMIKTPDLSAFEFMIEVKSIHAHKGSMDPMIKDQLFNAFENIGKYANVKALFFVSTDVPSAPETFPLVCIGINTQLSSTFEIWVAQGRPTHFVDFISSNSRNFKQTAMMKLDSSNRPSAGFSDLKDTFSMDLIKRAWKTIWDAIWGGTLESNKKFENFNKVLLAKIYDERKTRIGVSYCFQRKFKAGVLQSDLELATDIDVLYRKAYIEYFSKDKSTDISAVKGIDFTEFSQTLVCTCVNELFQYSFDKNLYKNVDILGEFYEMVIRESFKQTKGLFLTHPNIVLFILAALDIKELTITKLRTPDEDSRYRLPFVIDPSCGTGTFLVYYMNYIQKIADEEKSEIAAGDSDVLSFIGREMQGENRFKWVKDFVFGLDSDAALATACQINQILHGDGSTNIYCADGLDEFEHYSELDIVGAHNILSSGIHVPSGNYTNRVVNKFDVVISNPPFNVKMDKEKLRGNFSVTGKSEAYFLERWYQLLKPHGRLGVVLPESFFSVAEDFDGRKFLYTHFNIKCIVSLPNFTFSPHTTTSTSLLFAEKKGPEEELAFKTNYACFESIFKENLNKVLNVFPSQRTDIDFENANSKSGIKTILERIESLAEDTFGAGFVVFPFFVDAFLLDAKNYRSIKKKIKDTLSSIETQWIFYKMHCELDVRFFNYSVENIGYKSGKKGSKEKPNELMTIRDEHGQQIYDLKYAHSWKTICYNDLNTVLGQIKERKIWE